MRPKRGRILPMTAIHATEIASVYGFTNRRPLAWGTIFITRDATRSPGDATVEVERRNHEK